MKIGVAETTTEVRELSPTDDGLDLYRFIKIEPQNNSKVDYPFWIGKYPVTNIQYERFLKSPDFANHLFWLELPKFDEQCRQIGNWGVDGIEWLNKEIEKNRSKLLYPRLWHDKDFGRPSPNNPVVSITWYEASAYCEWLSHNWNTLSESKANTILRPHVIRLPSESEWEISAGGNEPNNRYPWDEAGSSTTSLKEILRRANVKESNIEHPTPVNQFLHGKSPFGLMDLGGNTWEWQANFYDDDHIWLALRGGSYSNSHSMACVAQSHYLPVDRYSGNLGFRIVCIPE